MGARIEDLPRFTADEFSEGERYVELESAKQAAAEDERELREEVARLRALLQESVKALLVFTRSEVDVLSELAKG
jgi:hypothetical protein